MKRLRQQLNKSKHLNKKTIKSERQIKAETAKSQGWKRTECVNMGSESYRVYVNSNTGEEKLIDGKNQEEHLASLAKELYY